MTVFLLEGGTRVSVILDWSYGSSEDTTKRILDGVSSTAEEKLIDSRESWDVVMSQVDRP